MSNSSSNQQNLPPFGEQSTPQFSRRSQQRLPLNQPISASFPFILPANITSTPQQFPSLSSLPENSSYRPIAARQATQSIPNQLPTLLRGNPRYSSIPSIWNTQNNLINHNTSIIVPQSSPQTSYTTQSSNNNVGIANLSRRGNYIGGSQRRPNQGQNINDCNFYTTLQTALAEIEALREQLRRNEQTRQNDFTRYQNRIQLLTREINSLKEMNREKERLCTETLEQRTILRNENQTLKENKTKFISFVQKITKSLKNSITAFQNHFGIHVENTEENEGLSGHHDFGGVEGQKELLELNKIALNLEKAKKNIAQDRATGPQQPALPPVPLLLPILGSLTNQVAAKKTSNGSNEQQDKIRLTFSQEEDRSATVLQTNQAPPPAIASTSKQAILRDLQANIATPQKKKTLSKQRPSMALAEIQQRAQDCYDSDSSDCLIIDEGVRRVSSGESIDKENEQENNDRCDKRRKLRDEILSSLFEHDQPEEILSEGEEASEDESRYGETDPDDDDENSDSDEEAAIRELEEMEIAAAGLYDYATCSCGKEVAFLNPDFTKVEKHKHFRPSNPSDVLVCRFCKKTFRDTTLYKQHLTTEHGLQFFTIPAEMCREARNQE